MAYSVRIENSKEVIPSLESFILYYQFSRQNIGTPAKAESFYSAYLTVTNSAASKGQDSNTASPTWNGKNGIPMNVSINEIGSKNKISWRSGSFFSTYRVKCGHSHTTLHITGLDGGLPGSAGGDWKKPFPPQPPQFLGGAPYMAQKVGIGNRELPVHTVFYAQDTGSDFAGYVGHFCNTSGFDSLLETLPLTATNPFPKVDLKIPGIPSFDTKDPNCAFKGAALVVSGSFKKRLGLVSNQYRELLDINSPQRFSRFAIGLVSEMNLVQVPDGDNVKNYGLKVEICDKKVLPQDESSDDPVEIILFG